MVKGFPIYYIFWIVFLLVGCEDSFRNPYDEKAPKDFWAPTELNYYVESLHSCKISWSQTSEQFDEYVIDKYVDDNWIIGYGKCDKTKSSWVDENYSYNKNGPLEYRVYATANSNESDKPEIVVLPTLPVLTTNPVTSITASTAVCGGNITDDGFSKILACGVCWSTSENPTIADFFTNNGSNTGEFVSNIAALIQDRYYVRAYATNAVGTAYGQSYRFTRTFLDGTIQYRLDMGQTPEQIINSGTSANELYGKLYLGGLIVDVNQIGTGFVCSQIDIVGYYSDGTCNWQQAVDYCHSYDNSGFTDWYLPTIEQLNLMYDRLRLNNIGSFTGDAYWSSTEYASNGVGTSAMNAYYQYFNETNYYQGKTNYTAKTNSNFARAVRDF